MFPNCVAVPVQLQEVVRGRRVGISRRADNLPILAIHKCVANSSLEIPGNLVRGPGRASDSGWHSVRDPSLDRQVQDNPARNDGCETPDWHSLAGPEGRRD